MNGQLEGLVNALPSKELIDRRNRFLILLAYFSALKLDTLTKLQLWQLTYFVSIDNGWGNTLRYTHHKISGIKRYPLGIYLDNKFKRISQINAINQNTFKAYIESLLEYDNNPNGYVFSPIRKNARPELQRHISIKDAHKILKKIINESDLPDNLTWPDIRQAGVIRKLRNGKSIQEIAFETEYKSLKAIKNIAKKYNLTVINRPNFKPPKRTGVYKEDSILAGMEPYYNKVDVSHTD